MCRNIKTLFQTSRHRQPMRKERSFAAVREEVNRLQQAVQDNEAAFYSAVEIDASPERSARLAPNHCTAQGPGGRGGQGESAPALRFGRATSGTSDSPMNR